MSHLKTITLRAFIAVSTLFLLSSTVAAKWPVKIDHGYGQTLAVDAAGDIIAAGSIVGPTLDVYKLSGRDGSLIWSYQYFYGMASKAVVDLNGDVIVGSYAGALIKISGVNGARLWLVSEFESVTGVKTDAQGNVFAVGRGNGRFKAVKVDTDGKLSWRYLSRPGVADNGREPSHDTAYALALGLDGDVIAAGVRDQDFTLVKISGQYGIEVGQQKIDGPGTGSHFFEKAVSVVVGADGSVFAAGATSPDFDRRQGPSNFTVAKFSGDLVQNLWFREIDGEGGYIDEANDLTLDPAGNVVAAGVLFNTYWGPNGIVIFTGDQFTVVKLSGQTGEVIWNESADFDDKFPTRGIGYAVTTNAQGDVFATGLFNEAFTVVRKFAGDGKNVWRRLEIDALIHGVGYSVILDAQQAVIATGQNTAHDRNKFTVLKLDPATGEDYVEAVPETVRKYAPMVYLHPDDKYRPGHPATFINRSELRWSHQTTSIPCGDHSEASRGSINPHRLGRASTSSSYSHHPRNTSNQFCRHREDGELRAHDRTRPFDGSERQNILGTEEGYIREGFFLDPENDENHRRGIPDTPGSPIYPGAPVFYDYEPGKFVEYWFFYPYNQYAPPLPNFEHYPLQSHEGDWERISIQLDADNRPLSVFYYHHKDGIMVPWGAVSLYDGTHPIVYSAIGSHGSYPTADYYKTALAVAFDHTAAGPKWLTWENLSPVKEQPWYGFGGAWGEVSSVINVPTPIGNISGGDFTGPLGPSKYKLSRAQSLFTLSGRVTGLNGAAIREATLLLTGLQGDVIATAFTGADGRYHFHDLAFGRSYAVTPYVEGMRFTPASRTLLNVSENLTADFKEIDTTPPLLNLPPDITVNAESAQGATVYYNVSATDNVTEHPRIGCAPLSGALFPIGTTQAICAAIDDAGNRADGTFKVTVKGAATQVNDLIVSIKGFNLESGVENSMIGKLQNVLSQVNAGNRTVACNQLNAFANQVKALAGKKLSAAEARQVLITVNRLAVVLGC